jgi:hypothetical protein
MQMEAFTQLETNFRRILVENVQQYDRGHTRNLSSLASLCIKETAEKYMSEKQ